MNRRQLITTISSTALLSVTGCTNNPEDQTQPNGPNKYPFFRRDLRNTGYIDWNGIADYRTQWKNNIASSIWSSPIVANGKIYIGTYDKKFHALDLNTGDINWTFSGLQDRTDTTAAYANGTVYIGGFDKHVYALDSSTGKPQWSREFDHIVRSSPKVANGVLYFGSGCHRTECDYYYPDTDRDENGGIHAYDAETGDVVWENKIKDSIISSPAIADDTVYVGTSAEDVRAYNATTGEKNWEKDTEWGIRASPVVTKDRIYVCDSILSNIIKGDMHRSENVNVYCLSRETGEEVWKKSFDGRHISSSPAIDDENIYVGISGMTDKGQERGDGLFISFDRETGNKNWSLRLTQTAIGASPLVGKKDVYIGHHKYDKESFSPGLTVVDKSTGNERWKLGIDSIGVGGSPCAVEDKIVFPTSSGVIHCKTTW